MSTREIFLKSLKKNCLPGVWAKGLQLARSGAVSIDPAAEDGELRFRVRATDKPLGSRVEIWPNDDDSFCDCRSKVEPCDHIAAACAFLLMEENTLAPPSSVDGKLLYSFTRDEKGIRVLREIKYKDRNELLRESLVARIGGIKSGRLPGPPLSATQEDLAIDRVLTHSGVQSGNQKEPSSQLSPTMFSAMFPYLVTIGEVRWNGETVKVQRRAPLLIAEVVSEKNGFRLRKKGSASSSASKDVAQVAPGFVLDSGVLRPSDAARISPEERTWIEGKGSFWGPSDLDRLITEVIPRLAEFVEVDTTQVNLPKLMDAEPRIQIKVQELEGDKLSVTPELVYGDPAVARLNPDGLEALEPMRRVRRDLVKERILARKVQTDLHLALGQISNFAGSQAIEFRKKLQGWDVVSGIKDQLKTQGMLVANFDFSEDQDDWGSSKFGVKFKLNRGEGSDGDREFEADTIQVLRAWRNQENFVPLIGGGWAELPSDWLQKYGGRLQSLLTAQEEARLNKKQSPRHFAPVWMDLAHEMGAKLPGRLESLRSALSDPAQAPVVKTPKDLKADLRHYQLDGVRWMTLLRESEMGALLADDMGLGKTLQTLCVIKGRSLVVCPTSVLSAWKEQTQRFRPKLKIAEYSGATRKINPKADITLVSYAVLRLDRAELCAIDWDTIVLDEAQNIKNAESQTAQAAFALQGRFRLALTGTPIENRLEDLWSQFHFINPGLLGNRPEFLQLGTEEVRRRAKPFILRRLKRDVAPELPPRTEVILQCELDQEERTLYDAILASTKKELVEQLGKGSTTLQVLEALLRLRQSCCHRGLIPGQKAPSSSKIDLLLETLEESIGLGHRALVFSQWTSLLDRVEPALKKSNISFIRLDGSTKDRAGIVSKFQDPKGPSVLLISLKAGGAGLTLTAADHVYILDPWWNPAVEDQAADRTHRIGQTQPVLIHRLVAKDTVEERVLALQKRKQELATSILNEGDAALRITAQDIREILG